MKVFLFHKLESITLSLPDLVSDDDVKDKLTTTTLDEGRGNSNKTK